MENKYPNKLKEYRCNLKLTQKQVADILGMQCQDRLSHWEKGLAIPNIKNLMKLAKVYTTTVEELYPQL